MSIICKRTGLHKCHHRIEITALHLHWHLKQTDVTFNLVCFNSLKAMLGLEFSTEGDVSMCFSLLWCWILCFVKDLVLSWDRHLKKRLKGMCNICCTRSVRWLWACTQWWNLPLHAWSSACALNVALAVWPSCLKDQAGKELFWCQSQLRIDFLSFSLIP